MCCADAQTIVSPTLEMVHARMLCPRRRRMMNMMHHQYRQYQMANGAIVNLDGPVPIVRVSFALRTIVR
jgi:hypothetical protein